MAIEIERKFLIKDEAWKEGADQGTAIIQAYLAGNDNASVRVRIAGDHANINIKSAELNIRRSEYEYPIPVDDARQMIKSLCPAGVVEKTRYRVANGKHTWEIDVFEGDNKGLIVAEIELSDEDEAFQRTEWLGEEVSDDPRYYNVHLIDHPYKDW